MKEPSIQERPLSGRHGVVTGGGTGIGYAVARALATLGTNLTLISRDLARLEACCQQLRSEFSLEFRAAAADLTVPEQAESAFAKAERGLGEIGLLVNNAGGAESAPFLKTDLELWRKMIDLNLTSLYLCTKCVLPKMFRARYGRIVNIASTAGVKGYPYVTAYAAAKHGVIGLTRSLALETARSGITVNAVCPSYTDTDLVRKAIASVAERTGRNADEVRHELQKSNPQNRFITPDEVGSSVAWLCRDEQSGITGQSIVIAGGEV